MCALGAASWKKWFFTGKVIMERIMKFFRSLLMTATLSGVLFAGHHGNEGHHGNADVAEAEDNVNQQMRCVISADISAHGRSFGPKTAVPPALLAAIAGKRLVGLGEGTHGTAEIQNYHANIILALAKKGRVLVFLEDQFGAVAPVNQFVQGVGADADLVGLMQGLYGVHKTLEMENFFKAARKFNAKAQPGAKIEIYGVDDMVYAGPADVTPALQAFGTANNLDLDAQIAVCSAYTNDPSSYTPEMRAAFVGAAAKIQLAVSGVAPTVAGQVEAAVMANCLVRSTAH